MDVSMSAPSSSCGDMSCGDMSSGGGSDSMSVEDKFDHIDSLGTQSDGQIDRGEYETFTEGLDESLNYDNFLSLVDEGGDGLVDQAEFEDFYSSTDPANQEFIEAFDELFAEISPVEEALDNVNPAAGTDSAAAAQQAGSGGGMGGGGGGMGAGGAPSMPSMPGVPAAPSFGGGDSGLGSDSGSGSGVGGFNLRDMIEQLLRLLDANGDGVISEEEMLSMDQDGDGMITEGEFDAFKAENGLGEDVTFESVFGDAITENDQGELSVSVEDIDTNMDGEISTADIGDETSQQASNGNADEGSDVETADESQQV